VEGEVVCHGGRPLSSAGVYVGGELGLVDRAFPGGLGNRHGREVEFQCRQHLAYQANVLLLHLVVFWRLLGHDGD
jgi:hypothetical protein